MPESLPEDQITQPADTPPQAEEEDARTDIEQAVKARSDALDRGEGGPEPDAMTSPGNYTGNAGTGGEVKNQDLDAQ